VMDVDDAMRVGVHKFVGEYLHVAGEHDEVGLMLLQNPQKFLLRRTLPIFFNRHSLVRNAIEVGGWLVVGVIRNDDGNVARQFSALMAIQEVHQAMVVLGDQDCHLLPWRRLRQMPPHVEALGYGIEVAGKISEWNIEIGGIKFHAHQEQV
jgi:hypothetical protein